MKQIWYKYKTISYATFEYTSYILFLKIEILIQNIRTVVQKKKKKKKTACILKTPFKILKIWGSEIFLLH